MNVAIYARAHDPGALERIQAQLELCREACRRNGWNVVAEYSDRTLSSVPRRPGLEEMLVAAGKGGFEAVVIPDLHRVSRSGRRLESFFADLERAGVSVSRSE